MDSLLYCTVFYDTQDSLPGDSLSGDSLPRESLPSEWYSGEYLFGRQNRQYLPEVLTGEIIFSTIKLDKIELDRWQNLVALSLLQSLERVQLRCNAKESNYNFFFLTVLDNFYYYIFAVKHRRESQQLVNYSAKKSLVQT